MKKRVLIRMGVKSEGRFVEIGRKLLPIFEHPIVQRLRLISQYGLGTLLTFPGAERNRLDHSLGVYDLATLLGDKLVLEGEIDEVTREHLKIAGLIHDVPHGPLSHELEPLLGDHEKRVEVYDELEDVIEGQGFDYAYVKGILTQFVPEAIILHDKVLGIDALEYLSGDLPRFGYKSPVSPTLLLPVLHYRNGVIGLEAKTAEEGRRTQQVRANAYTSLYRRKSPVLTARRVQQLVEELMEVENITTHELARWTDFQLLSALYNCPKTSNEFKRLVFQRELPKQAVALKIEGYEHAEVKRGKPIHVCGSPIDDLKELERELRDLAKRRCVEEEIAELVGARYAVVTIPHYGAEKIASGLLEEDVKVFDGNEVKSIFSIFPSHHKSILETYSAHYAIRVGVPPESRGEAAERGEDVIDLLFG